MWRIGIGLGMWFRWLLIAAVFGLILWVLNS